MTHTPYSTLKTEIRPQIIAVVTKYVPQYALLELQSTGHNTSAIILSKKTTIPRAFIMAKNIFIFTLLIINIVS